MSMVSVGLLSLFLMTCGVDVPKRLPWGYTVSWEGQVGGSSGCRRGAAQAAVGRGREGRPWAVVRPLPRAHSTAPLSLSSSRQTRVNENKDNKRFLNIFWVPGVC